MSATQDKTQKVAFVYSNLYQIYRKGKEAAQNAEPVSSQPFAAPSGAVLKTGDLRAEAAPKPSRVIEEYKPAEFIAKRVVPRPAALPSRSERLDAPSQREAISSLKDNLKQLNDLHSRLRFMLLEIEDLVKE